jgi:predicted dehydrogenase
MIDRVKRFFPRNPRRSSTIDPPISESPGNILPPPCPLFSAHPPQILIIGAGSRGHTYARCIMLSSNGMVAAVADPVEFRRKQLGKKYIWGITEPKEGMEFSGWKEFVEWEVKRRERESRGEDVPVGIDGVFVCTLDETHVEIVTALAPLNLHVLCEKPLATTLDDCLRIYASLLPKNPLSPPTALFAVGHIMRYSPHNVLLRKLLLEDEVVGDVVSVEHTEPIGWWHFSHSYVR